MGHNLLPDQTAIHNGRWKKIELLMVSLKKLFIRGHIGTLK